MSAAHTKGPVHPTESGVLMDPEGRALAVLGVVGFDLAEMLANERRLAACWNACEQLADPSAVPALVEALEALLAIDDDPERSWEDIRTGDELDDARAALRRARGET